MITIKLKNLRLKTIVGVYDWEQNIQRELIINLIIELNISKSMNDNLVNTIDYEELTNIIKDIVKNERFRLIESMVERIIAKIRVKYQDLQSVFLEIDKLGAIAGLESFAVVKKWHKNDSDN